MFIECFVSNQDDVQLKEHLDFRWIYENEFKNFDFLEGDMRFIEYYNELKK